MLLIIACIMLVGIHFSQAQSRISKKQFSDTIPPFSSVYARGNVKITYRQDDFYSVTFKGTHQVFKDVYSSIKFDKWCLKIDASRLFQNEFIYVEIIAPVIDTVILYDGAVFLTPTNVWQKSMYVENYSQHTSIIYVNSPEFRFICKGQGQITFEGIVDILYVNIEGKVKLETEVISKYIQVKTYQHTLFIGKGKSFVCDCHSYHHSLIDASLMQCGKAKAFASDESTIYIKSEEKPLLLPLSKGKINFFAPENAVVIDSTQIGNIKKLK